MGGARRRRLSAERAARGARGRVRGLLQQRLRHAHHRRPERGAPVRADRRVFGRDPEPHFLRVRLPRALDERGHGMLLLARVGAPRRARASRRRGERRPGRRREHPGQPVCVAGVFRAWRDFPDRAHPRVLRRRRRHRPRRRRGLRGAQARGGRGARRRPRAGRDQGYGNQFRRSLQRPDRAEPGGAGGRAAPRLRRRGRGPARGGPGGGARHGHHLGRPDRGHRAGRSARPRARRGVAAAFGLGEIQHRPLRIRRRRGGDDQGARSVQTRHDPADHQLHGAQPLRGFRRGAHRGRPGPARVAALLRASRGRHLRFRFRRHERARRRGGLRPGGLHHQRA